MSTSAASVIAWTPPSAYHKVRRRGGEAVIIDAAPGTPQSALLVIGRMRIAQVVAFDFSLEADLARFRQHLYHQQHKSAKLHGWQRRYITRAHGPWVMVMRIA